MKVILYTITFIFTILAIVAAYLDKFDVIILCSFVACLSSMIAKENYR